MQIGSAKELIAYQKACQLAIAGERDQKTGDRRQKTVSSPPAASWSPTADR
jgi:hypothetical protein